MEGLRKEFFESMPRVTGEYRESSTAGKPVRAFVPAPLPPVNPPLRITPEIQRLHDQADAAMGRLRVAGRMVPSTRWFLYGFVRKEAVLTSVIEGTQATLEDVAAFEATKETELPEDVEEVCNYVDALKYARAQLISPHGLPISTRLLCETHRRLMRGARGSDKAPGQIRRIQNWVGGPSITAAAFVPPPPADVPRCMEELERWIHARDPLPPLIRAGLAHVQFETIHPFLDGNGRMGRLLVALLLETWGLMENPLLYLSVSIRRRQGEYYQRLGAVRTGGDWESWTEFFLECVTEAADDGIVLTGRLFDLLGSDRSRVSLRKDATVAALRLIDLLPENPVVTVGRAAKLLKMTAPTARKAVEVLARAGVLVETTGKRRDRVYSYASYLRTLTGDDR